MTTAEHLHDECAPNLPYELRSALHRFIGSRLGVAVQPKSEETP